MNSDVLCEDAPMTVGPAHFTQTDQDRFLPTGYAQSHWGDDHLNGPAMVGLAARTLEAMRYSQNLTTMLASKIFVLPVCSLPRSAAIALRFRARHRF